MSYIQNEVSHMSNTWSAPIPNTVMEERLERQLEYKNPVYSILFRFCITTGMMLSEAILMKVSELKGAKQVTIENFSKSTKNYTVILDERTKAGITALCANKAGNDYVFKAITKDAPLNYATFAKALRSTAASLGLENINTLSLRKTHIMHIYRTYGIRYATTLLGKDNVSLTYEYLGIQRSLPDIASPCLEREKMLTNDFGIHLVDNIIHQLEQIKAIMNNATNPDIFYIDTYRDLSSIYKSLENYDSIISKQTS